MTFDNLLVERDGACAAITLNRPSVLNAISAGLLTELDGAIAALQQDATVRAIVITGAGEKAFAAGADIRELSTLSGEGARAYAAFGQQVFERLERLDKPVIAAINGFALGGGCELALACTLRVASESASLGQPEINLGLSPGFGGSERLPRLVGRSRALDLLLTGRIISARDALAMGLVDRVVPQETLRAAAWALASELASKAPLAVRAILDAVRGAMATPASPGQSLESTLFGLLSTSDDAKEGTAAFLEKRSPRFHGR